MKISRLLFAQVVVLASYLAFGQDIFAARTTTSAGSSVQIFRNGKVHVLASATAFEPLSWSTDGRWLALGKRKGEQWQLALFDSTSPVDSLLELSGEFSAPSWSPDGKQFVVSKEGQGIFICNVAGSDPVWKPLTPAGKDPIWSPLRGQIAFIGPKGGAGAYTVSEDGKSQKPIVPDQGIAHLSWSPDGRALSYSLKTKTGSTLMIFDSTKNKRTKKCEYDGGPQKWSPDGKTILVKKAKQWSAIDLTSTSEIALGIGIESPEWLDSKSIMAIKGGKFVTIKYPKLTTEPSQQLPVDAGAAGSFALFRGIVIDGSFANPFALANPPEANQIRLVGTVENVELLEDTATIRVWSVLTPDKMELNLSQPLIQEVAVVNESLRQRNKTNTRLSISDLIPGSEIAIWVRGYRAGVPDALKVDKAWIPELVDIDIKESTTSARAGNIEYDGVSMDTITVPLVFPVLGKVNWSDTFLANRDGGARRHHGQDLMAPKMRPLVATFDGIVRFNTSKSGHNTITIRGADGWTAIYMHVNNDNPGTDDGKGGPRFAFAPGLKSGDTVTRGQLVGFCGDSGNAESTGPHCHFELHDETSGAVFNACPSLESAEKITEPVAKLPSFEGPSANNPLRWDLVVTQVDQDRKVIVGELISVWRNGQSAQANLKPQKVYLKVDEGTSIALRMDKNQMRKFENFKVGQFISALGDNSSVPERMEAKVIGIGLDFDH